MIVDEARESVATLRDRPPPPVPSLAEASRLSVLTVIGTRPEAIKLAPVIRELARRPAQVRSSTCVTGQHRDLADTALASFGVVPDHDLRVMRPAQSPTDVTARILERLEPVLASEAPDWVVVQGDTSTVLAVALAAFHGRIRVAHVEAGLRTNDLDDPFPEEANRRLVSLLANLHLAPTEVAQQNLLREGVPADSVVVTGNPGIDALLTVVEGMPTTARGNAPGGARSILATLHRRESFGPPIERICVAIRTIATERDVRITIPVHPNPAVREPVRRILGATPHVALIDPVDYGGLVELLTKSDLVMTDSGGLQEEAATLGRPVLVLRETTERAEAVDAGSAIVVGRDTERITTEAFRLLDDANAYAAMAVPRPVFGDGRAAPRIVDAILDSAGRRSPVRSTHAVTIP